MPRCRVNTSMVPGPMCEPCRFAYVFTLGEWIFWMMRGESLYVIYAYIFLDNIMTAFFARLSLNPEVKSNFQTPI